MQAEERAQLCLASKKQSHMLRLRKSDCVLYAARVIPGNDKQVGLSQTYIQIAAPPPRITPSQLTSIMFSSRRAMSQSKALGCTTYWCL